MYNQSGQFTGVGLLVGVVPDMVNVVATMELVVIVGVIVRVHFSISDGVWVNVGEVIIGCIFGGVVVSDSVSINVICGSLSMIWFFVMFESFGGSNYNAGHDLRIFLGLHKIILLCRPSNFRATKCNFWTH